MRNWCYVEERGWDCRLYIFDCILTWNRLRRWFFSGFLGCASLRSGWHGGIEPQNIELINFEFRRVGSPSAMVFLLPQANPGVKRIWSASVFALLRRDRCFVGDRGEKVPGTNGGSLSGILPSLTQGNRTLGPKSNMGCSEAAEQFLNEPPFVPCILNSPTRQQHEVNTWLFKVIPVRW